MAKQEKGSRSSRNNNGDDDVSVQIPDTAHEVSTDSWLQVGVVLSTAVDSAYALGYSGTIMVPLGWIGGVVGLFLAICVSLYASILIANLHELGGKRHIRYRDLAGFIYGPTAYSIIWGLQYANLFLINIGYVILGGQALKAFYTLFSDDHGITLPYFIIIAGVACLIFAIGVPHLSALRIWLWVSTLLSVVYFVVAFVLSLKDGLRSPPRDYSIHGTKEGKIFTTIGAAGNLVFAFNTGMLPEIQATVKEPAVKNMMKALYFQFTIGVVPMLAVTFMGYWAYGSSASTYLLNNAHGPLWVKAFANLCAFLQAVISLHIFASPTYEYLDTRYGISGAIFAPRNLGFRALVRGGYLVLTAFLSALLPFLGDFMSLTGAISVFPLTFILANHMYLVAHSSTLGKARKGWHWLNIVFFSCLSIAAFVAAIHMIIIDSKTYHLFADL